MTAKTTNAPTEQARRKLLTEVKESQLDKEWTPTLSKLVDYIDEVLNAEA